MKITQLAFASLFSLGLVACSGNSSGGHSANTQTQPKENIKPAENYALVETVITVPRNQNKEPVIDTHKYLRKSYFRMIEIDGKEIDIFPTNESKFIDIDNEQRHHYAKQYENTLVGVINNRTQGNEFYVFTQAINPTKDMPTMGIVQYSGTAIHGYDKNGKNNYENMFIDGKAHFIADFNTKTIKGTISAFDNQFDSIALEGQITQNYFMGEKNGITLKGGFFGEKAAEISGRYFTHSSPNAVSGVFAAEKEKK